MDTTTMPNKPVAMLRDGRLKAALWRNENREGEQYFSVTLAKTYEDKDGNPKDTTSFSESELLRIAELAKEMRGVMLDMRRDRAHERSQLRSKQPDPSSRDPQSYDVERR